MNHLTFLLLAAIASANVPGQRTAFRLGRPTAEVWVNEKTVEGASAGGHAEIRLLEAPQSE